MAPKIAIRLTKQQARDMQDQLIAGYSDTEFQKKLHMIWFVHEQDHVRRIQKRQELCLEIQGPIIEKFGFEPNRKGVGQSVSSFRDPDIAYDPEIIEHNAQLEYLVNPNMQLGQTEEPPEREAPARAEAKPKAAPAPKPQPQAPRQECRPTPKASAITRPVRLQPEKTPEEAFLLRFQLSPPGGFKVPDVVLTQESAIQMLDELIGGFRTGEFQRKLREAIGSAGGDQRKAVVLRQQICMQVQIPIVKRYGFEPSFDGILKSAQAFTMELNMNTEIAQKNATVFWLIDPTKQAQLPVPKGPVKIRFEASVRVHDWNFKFLTEIESDITDTVKHLKQNIQLKLGMMWQGTRVYVGNARQPHEVDDWMALSMLTHTGAVLDVIVGERRADVVSWLQRILKEGIEVLKTAPEALLRDPEFLVPAISNQVRVLQYAAPELQRSREFILRIIAHHGQALQFASPDLQADEEVVLAAIHCDGWALQYAAPTIQANRRVVLAAVHQDGWALQFAAPALRADREVVLVAASNDAWIIANASPELQADRQIIFTAIQQDWRVLETVIPSFRSDRELVLFAVSRDGLALEFASEELKGDRWVVFAAVKRTGEALRFASQSLMSDREIAFTAVKTYGVSLGCVAPEIQDLEMVLAAIKQDMRAMTFVVPHLQEAVRQKLGFHSFPAGGRFKAQDAPGSRPSTIPNLKKHYEVLGLRDDCSKDDIKRKYKILALKHHPDKHPDDPEGAKRLFQTINNAYQSLKEVLRF